MIKQNFLCCVLAVLGVASTSVSCPAALVHFGATLSGLNEVGPVVTNGTGSVLLTLDDVAFTLRVNSTFSGLTGTTTQAHIHATAGPGANAGVAVTPGTLPSFPVGVTAATYVSPVIDLSLDATYTAAFLTANGGSALGGARTAFINALNGQAYFNIHTSAFGGGEIRGNLSVVPEPSSMALLGLATIGGVVRAGWRRRKKA